MTRIVKIGLVQVKLDRQDDWSAKCDKLYELGAQCLANGADLVFFPEAYQHEDDTRPSILQRPDELRARTALWQSRCAELARSYQAYVVPWDYEIDNLDQRFNTSYILDRTGMEVGRYRKAQLTYGELKAGIRNGMDYPVFDLDFGRIGIMICFDNYWPESSRILGLRGAELILYPLYGDTLLPQWKVKLQARAIDNSLYIASSQIGSNFRVAFTGLVNPWGEVISKIDDAPAWRVVEADLDRPVITSTCGSPRYRENLRQYLNKCRNPAAFKPLSEITGDLWSWEDVYLGQPWRSE